VFFITLKLHVAWILLTTVLVFGFPVCSRYSTNFVRLLSFYLLLLFDLFTLKYTHYSLIPSCHVPKTVKGSGLWASVKIKIIVY